MSWADDYRAAKARAAGGAPPPQQYQQAPQQGYQQPYVPQGPPAHAPFGYDPQSGVPVAPWGRDAYGHIITQPPPPQGYHQQSYDPRGLPVPQGYGQPPYGQPQGYPGQQPPPGQWQQQEYDPNPLPQDPNAMIPYMQAAQHWHGTKQVQEHVGICPDCGGHMFDRSTMGNGGGGGASGRVTNVNTGQVATAAPICVNCGSNGGMFTQSGSDDLGGAAVVGEPRRAPGSKSLGQVAHQHGMLNLFAPEVQARRAGRQS